MSKVKAEASLEPVKKTYFTADTIAYWISFLGISLLPLIVWPWSDAPFSFGRAFWVFLLVLLTVLFWLIGRLQKSQIILPKNLSLPAGLAVVVATFLSGVFSDNLTYFLFGKVFAFQSFVFTLTLFLLFFLVGLLYEKRQRVVNLYICLFMASIFAGLYTVLRLLVGFLSDSSFVSTWPVNLIGGWYDLGIFFGFIAISTLIILELWPAKESKWFNSLLYLVFGFSLLMIILANFYLVWIVFGLFSLFLFVYTTTMANFKDPDNPESTKAPASVRFMRPALIALLISIFFVIFGSTDGLLSNTLNQVYSQAKVSFIDIRPSWSGTMTVVKGALKDDILFGAGASNFDQAWSLYRPNSVNQLPYWDMNFTSGVGIIPSLAATSGLVGLAAWLFFLLSLFFYGLKGVFDKKQDTLTRLMVFLLFVGTVYLWVFAFIYSVSITLFTLAFIVSGLLIGQLTTGRTLPSARIDLNHDPRFHFVAVLILILLMMMSLAGLYLIAQKYWALNNFYQAVNLNQTRPLAETEEAILQSVNLDSYNDLYFRALVDVGRLNLNALLTRADTLSETELQDSFRLIFGQTLGYADRAIALNPSSYQNWSTRGILYEILVPFQVDGAAAEARRNYNQALVLNPNSPGIHLDLARLSLAEEDTTGAYGHLEDALAQKSNFVEALFMIAQLDLRVGDPTSAMRRSEQAVLIAPNDPFVYFQQGVLKYNLRNFLGAISDLERALELSPNQTHDNARYFLGLSYSQSGRLSDALDQFILLEESNPDNAEVKRIISNLRSGLPALSGLEAPTLEDSLSSDEVEETITDDIAE